MANTTADPDQRPSGTGVVVDDDPELPGPCAAMLENRHGVRTATSGEAARRQFTRDVDVVLLDWQLPETTSEGVLDVVRTDGYDYPVAMVTAAEPDVGVTELAFDAYVVEPMRRYDRLAVVSELVLRSENDAGVRERLRDAVGEVAADRQPSTDRPFDGR